jgi:uncharacterized alkaline shock family protein YloU
MGEHATISSDILASYAADAALEVDGVHSLVERHLPRHRGIRVIDDEGRVSFELHLAVEWGASIPRIGQEVQSRVAEYLVRMADLEAAKVDVIVDEIYAP